MSTEQEKFESLIDRIQVADQNQLNEIIISLIDKHTRNEFSKVADRGVFKLPFYISIEQYTGGHYEHLISYDERQGWSNRLTEDERSQLSDSLIVLSYNHKRQTYPKLFIPHKARFTGADMGFSLRDENDATLIEFCASRQKILTPKNFIRDRRDEKNQRAIFDFTIPIFLGLLFGFFAYISR